ncbi:HmuY family protein [Chishuiella changwenlii]|uniref:HmuY family protein n=1 Tax=Chishuiella changwenlii TaxID=1434701 RepID=UPI002FDA16E9
MKIYSLILVIITSIFLSSCSDESSPLGLDFVAAFKNESIDFSKIEEEETIQLVFSKTAEQDGQVHIRISAENANYDVDYTTLPAATQNEIIVPIKKGQSTASFTFKNLIYPFDRSDKKVQFEIVKIDYPAAVIQGYKSLSISFDRSIGGTMSPEVGGPNQPYQVYIDLSKSVQTKVRRDSWDLGFYNGSYFRVVLNGSIYMATKALTETDITKVTKASVNSILASVAVGTFSDSNKDFVDHPAGDILKTAIAEVKDNDAENPVYLLNLGYEVGNTTPSAGSVAIAGSARGYKKVRFLKRGEDYLVQYANLDDTTFQEKIIKKNSTHNFTFLNLVTNSETSVEPEKLQWDLNFTVFTNLIEGNGSYGYSDFVVNNLKAGVKAYRVDVSSSVTYDNFNESMIDEVKFQNDQRVIGDSWRQVTSPQTIYTDRFYVLKDAENNYYKIKMTSFINASGIRGNPSFEYKLIK